MVFFIFIGPCIHLCCYAMRDRSPGYTTTAYNVLDVNEVRERRRQRTSPNVTKGLGFAQLFVAMTQLTIGTIMLVDLKDQNIQLIKIGVPLWVGGWILITSILTIISGYYNENYSLIRTAKVFNILTLMGSPIEGFIFLMTIGFLNCEDTQGLELTDSELTDPDNTYCRRKNEGIALLATLIGLMVVEFFVALFSAIYSGSPTGNCGPNYSGYVYTQPNPVQTATPVITSQTINMMQPQNNPTTTCQQNNMYSQQQQMQQHYTAQQTNMNFKAPPQNNSTTTSCLQNNMNPQQQMLQNYTAPQTNVNLDAPPLYTS